ncbi:tetratricopeptide repeat protein [Clostridium manihotivorum]|uniref:J domain-containing protein n=1 Tax=Clostridium manihotivorum TaxID=2320868 RepID=A0A3R5R2K2_9CLOT|nr:tetratricopeptide repeat protein [Clostridium manihotivorum]QAA35341.1 hypothetical protein C1I91_18445 [Clostridium manihotivorum]
MKNLYEVLEITPQASKEEIKKAYFKLADKYSVDRYEVEATKIREAYETLINDKTREQYDSISSLSNSINDNYNKALVLLEQGDLKSAIKTLESILKEDSNLIFIKSILGQCYIKNNNSGKAIKLFEELVQADQNNAAFEGYLGDAYFLRGWQKKAVTAYTRAVELDQDNVSLWLSLSDANVLAGNYEESKVILEKALSIERDYRANSIIHLRFMTLELSLGNDIEADFHLNKLIELSKTDDEAKNNLAWDLSNVSTYFLNLGVGSIAGKLNTAALSILPNDEKLSKEKADIDKFNQNFDLFQELMNDKNIKQEIEILIGLKVLPDSMLDAGETTKEDMASLNEYQILLNYEDFKSSIKHLKDKYSELYALKADFFEKASNSSEKKSLLEQYEKDLAKYTSFLDDLVDNEVQAADEEVAVALDEIVEEAKTEEREVLFRNYDEKNEPSTPYVREEPRIGRNEPCICGSGKKYKKCCGK